MNRNRFPYGTKRPLHFSQAELDDIRERTFAPDFAKHAIVEGELFIVFLAQRRYRPARERRAKSSSTQPKLSAPIGGLQAACYAASVGSVPALRYPITLLRLGSPSSLLPVRNQQVFSAAFWTECKQRVILNPSHLEQS